MISISLKMLTSNEEDPIGTWHAIANNHSNDHLGIPIIKC